jgi:hypothetical protein
MGNAMLRANKSKTAAKKLIRSLLSKRASLSGKFPDIELDNVQ